MTQGEALLEIISALPQSSEKLGQLFAEVRAQAQLSLRDWERLSGVSKSTLERWTKGEGLGSLPAFLAAIQAALRPIAGTPKEDIFMSEGATLAERPEIAVTGNPMDGDGGHSDCFDRPTTGREANMRS